MTIGKGEGENGNQKKARRLKEADIMESFDKRFNKQSEDFDRDFARMEKWSIATFAISSVFALGLIGFGIWVIVMILRFFGVV